MKRFITMIMAIALSTLGSQAQQFTVTRDTIHIDAGLFGETPKTNIQLRAAESREGLYLLMYHRESMESWGKNNLLFVERNNRTIRNIELPDILPIGYTDFQNIFVRHDSLILKVNAYHESDVSFYRWARERHDKEEMKKNLNFTLDTRTDQWIPVKSANDLIYEDDQYRVCYWECGEWGEYMEFRNKNTDKRYIYKANGRIVRHEGCYYIINTHQVMKIDDPTQGLPYQGSSWGNKKLPYTCPEPEVVMDLEDLVMPKGTNIPREILRNDPLIPSPPYTFCAAFVVEGKLFLLIESQTGLYVASYQGGELTKVQDIGCRAQHLRTNGYLLRENNHPDNQAFFQCEDVTTDNPVIVSVNGTNIRVTYIELEN